MNRGVIRLATWEVKRNDGGRDKMAEKKLVISCPVSLEAVRKRQNVGVLGAGLGGKWRETVGKLPCARKTPALRYGDCPFKAHAYNPTGEYNGRDVEVYA